MVNSRGEEILFTVYLRKRTALGRWHRVATFRSEKNAEDFRRGRQNPDQFFVLCGKATIADSKLARD